MRAFPFFITRPNFMKEDWPKPLSSSRGDLVNGPGSRSASGTCARQIPARDRRLLRSSGSPRKRLRTSIVTRMRLRCDISLAERGDRIRLCIEDDGGGIPEDAVRCRTGVGLRSMNHRVESSGGKLVLKRLKQGTRVSRDRADRPVRRSFAMMRAKRRILIVDDHAAVRRGASRSIGIQRSLMRLSGRPGTDARHWKWLKRACRTS